MKHEEAIRVLEIHKAQIKDDLHTRYATCSDNFKKIQEDKIKQLERSIKVLKDEETKN